MRIDRGGLLLSIASLVFVFAALEILLRLFTDAAFGLANPSFFGGESQFEFHPRLRYTLRHNQSYQQAYRDDDGSPRTVVVTTNSMGTRDALPSGDQRGPLMAFVGDSFTEGYHVDHQETYPALVDQAAGGHWRTVNLGVHNYDCINYYNMALFARDRFRPRVVIVGLFVGNDILAYNRSSYKAPPNDLFHVLKMRLRSSLYVYSWLAMLSPNRPNATSTSERPRAVVDADFFDAFDDTACPPDTLRQYTGQYTANHRNRTKTHLYADPWQMLLSVRATTTVLADLQRDLEGTRMHVLIFPERLQVRDEEWEWLQARFPEFYRYRHLVLERLKEEMSTRGIAFTDMLPQLDRRSYLRFDGHFSAQGHRRVAAAIVQALL